jgi:hypothetical protein
MMGWCPTKRKSFYLSAADIEEASSEARAWVAGFLAGNEPPPPTAQDGQVEFNSREYQVWQARVEVFRRDGHWEP